MYSHIWQAQLPTSRVEAAETVGISRNLAAFHPDTLVAAGLRLTRYEFGGDIR
ncbi:hypothetical protein [Amycolatopsis regifaucium]|uniref:hypothetical protein n=1 Tax=Amycolatopsis regifaucium TaxID=546365 RepID=UPI0008F64337|nr:hypothetical protein [Amycolatopsis regifaucium]SFH71080.1 hypothetical protein SAMN04489731_1067 [Amycolatopsis regifaucium]